jgi:D-lactate dehydrogenase
LPAPLISVRTQSVIPPAWAKDLQGILSRTTGYERLISYRRETDACVPCGYLPVYCARAVAEQAVLMVLTLMRKLKIQIRHFEIFNRDGLTGAECQGRNLLVVGVGHIGSEIVDIARGLRMNVKGVDLQPKLSDLEYVSLAKGIPWADIIICALPLTPETKGFLGYEALKKAKPEVVLVNIGRGEITPVEELKILLEDEVLGAVGLDVFPNESEVAEYLRGHRRENSRQIATILELKSRDNVLFTPHNAFNTAEAVERKAEQTVESIQLFLDKKVFPYPVPAEADSFVI